MELLYVLAGAICVIGGVLAARLINESIEKDNTYITADAESGKLTPLELSEDERKMQKQWAEMLEFDPLAKKGGIAEREED